MSAKTTAHRTDRWRRVRTAAVAVVAAVRNPLEVPDAFAGVQEATRRHRRAHGCGAYAYGEGSLPATLAAAVGARRIVEVGTALGYTALAMADAAPLAHVDTVETDPDHVRLAREQIARHGLTDRVTVRPGAAEEVLPGLDPGAYDLAFFDGFTPTLEVVTHLHRLLRPGGTLLAGNLILGPPPEATAHLSDPAHWHTHSLGETALCVKRAA
ncbi:class I SAM-dependent methyltransferase [Streptomyces sp. NPDC047014]|uniref:O-methyltransferase n=1 Tax=Streptomyces sp. NPDC047014 TaxID=3155736 RepID=UPI0033DA6FE4